MLHFLFFSVLCVFNEGLANDLNGKGLLTTDVIEWPCESNSDCEYAVNGTSCVNKICKCAAGFVFNAKMTSCIKVAATYGEVCEESIQCSRYLFSGGICMNAICVCSEGYYYMHGRCNAYSGLFGSCNKDDDCYVNGDFEATSCVNGTCKCSYGYYQREHRTCRYAAKAGDDKCVLDNDCQQFDNKTAECDFDNRCVASKITNINSTSPFLRNKNVDAEENSVTETEIEIGQKCEKNEECEILGNAICQATGSCVCKRANYYNEALKKCVPELGEPCDPKDDITIDYSECRNGIWSCERHKVASADNKKCNKVIKKYKDSCLRDVQCYAFGPDAICRNGSCVCNENSRFRETEKFCWTKRGIGDKCVEDADCFVDGMESKLLCSNNTCYCPGGTHANKNRTECVNAAAEIGSKCEVDDDCVADNSKCVEGVCACLDNYYVSDNNCIAGIGANCTANEDCRPENSECLSSNKCICKLHYVPLSTGICIEDARFGEPCQADIQCSSRTQGAICAKFDPDQNSVCACANDHHYKYDRCFKRKVLGETCKNLGECYVNHGGRSVCKNGHCSCDFDFIQENEITCVKSDGKAVKANMMTWISIIFGLLKYKF